MTDNAKQDASFASAVTDTKWSRCAVAVDGWMVDGWMMNGWGERKRSAKTGWNR